MQILVIEDEPQMAALLRSAFEEEGYRTTVAPDGVTGLRSALEVGFDLIVLDAMLPGVDGFSVARRLRRDGSQTPILMLTARDSERDAVEGLDAGADDYVTKPFSLEVLLARVRAVSRRGQNPQSIRLRAGDLVVDTATREVSRAGRAVALTPREYNLLALLLRNKGRVVSRETLLSTVWGVDSEVDGNTLEVFIRSLRVKIEKPPPAPRLIRTFRGIGYSLREGPDATR